MRPLQLTMKNFLPYYGKETVIDFSSISIAAITGSNGAGKSSIPQAVTWALYGRVDRPDLINHRASECFVKLVFSTENSTYSVTRTKGTGKSSLLLCSYDPKTGKEVNIGESKNITDVNKQISDLIGLDYRTFCMTVFVPQDSAANFASLKPADRKQALWEIAGNPEWDVYGNKFKDHLNKLNDENNNKKGVKSNLEESIKSKDSLLEQQTQNNKNLESIQDPLQHNKSLLAELKKQQTEYSIRKSGLSGRIQDYRSKISSLNLRTDEIRKTKEQIELKISRNSDLLNKESSSSIDSVRDEISLLREKEAEFNQLQAELRTDMAAMLSDMESVKRLDSDKADCTKKENQTLSEIAALEKEIKSINSDILASGDVQQTIQQKHLELNQLISDHAAISGSLEQLSASRDQLDGNSVCPVCGSSISDDQYHHLMHDFDDEISGKTGKMDSLGKSMAEIKSEIHLLEIEAEKVTCLGKSLSTKQSTLSMRRGTAEQLEERIRKGDEERSRNQYESRIQHAEAEKKRINDRIDQITASGYSDKRLSDLVSEENRLKLLEAEKQSIQKEQTDLGNSLSGIQAEIKSAEAQIADNSRQCTEAQSEYDALTDASHVPDYEANAQSLENEIASQEKHMNEYLTLKGELSNGLKTVEEAEKNLADISADLDRLQQEISDTRLLVQAYGKDGMKVMLIEQVRQLLEDEANEVLDIVSEHQMKTYLSTTKTTNSGEDRETLEITVERNGSKQVYESLSSGQQFKVAFSIRIGLARYLAAKSKTQMQTLIIDEGFGSQDKDGVYDLLSAIDHVKDQFGLILVISHLDDVQDSFTCEINVSSPANASHGSVVRVIDHE